MGFVVNTVDGSCCQSISGLSLTKAHLFSSSLLTQVSHQAHWVQLVFIEILLSGFIASWPVKVRVDCQVHTKLT